MREFLRVNCPEALTDGRFERLVEWTNVNGAEKLAVMLREHFGKDLDRPVLVDPREAEVRAHQLTLKLVGFYQAHPSAGAMTLDKVRRIAEWGVRHGENALNARLYEKYEDDLDSFAQRVALRLEPRLREFYAVVKPEILERGLGPILQWTAANGEQALNDLLYERYGRDLAGRRAPPVTADAGASGANAGAGAGSGSANTSLSGSGSNSTKPRAPGTSARALLRNHVLTSPTLSQADLKKAAQPPPLPARPTAVVPAGPKKSIAEQAHEMDAERKRKHAEVVRKELLISQLAAFLQIHDPERLNNGGLVPLVDWALSRTDREVDDLLLELYASDLSTEKLRRLSFSPADDQDALAVPIDTATRVTRAISIASESDYNLPFVPVAAPGAPQSSAGAGALAKPAPVEPSF